MNIHYKYDNDGQVIYGKSGVQSKSVACQRFLLGAVLAGGGVGVKAVCKQMCLCERNAE